MRSLPFTPAGDEIRWIDIPAGHGPAAAADAAAAADRAARVYVHGLGGTGGHTFAHIAGHPNLAGPHSLTIDLPGHGHSDRPTDFGYTLEEHAAAVAAVLDHEGLRGLDYVGHSMGGSIGIVLATLRPDLVGRLVVAEPVVDPLPPSSTGLGSQWIANRTEAEWIATGIAELMADDHGWAVTMRLCAPHAVYRSAVSLIAERKRTLREALATLPMPRTWIAGSDGEGIERARGLAESGVHVVTIENAGHSMMVDQPEAFVRELGEAPAARQPRTR
jgi:pimeloyl-ACP methyl ester carboxylesterase